VWRCPLRWRCVAGGSRVGVSTGAGTASVESGALTSTVCVFSSEAAGCSSATIVLSLPCSVRTTAATGGLGSGAANSGFDVGSNTHGLSASYDKPRHGLTFSRLAISGVMTFGSLTSRASTVFAGGASTSDFGAAVATVSVYGSKCEYAARIRILIRHDEREATRAGDQSDTH
jgi:hypothetical protein